MQVYHSLFDVQKALQEGTISCEKLVKDYLYRIEQQKVLNAYLEVFAEEALQKARKIDQKIAQKEPLGRLHGMIVGIKDVLCYQNHRISASSKILENFVSLYTATSVQRLIDEDVIIVGRLNCDEFAMGSTNENSAYGAVRNAYDNSKVPGGSSGGSAVAVQANLCLAALGTDTGGSVRQPASFCDVIGMKPTYGRISRHGLIAYASSFDQVGVFAKNMDDVALLLEIMAGKDDFDSTSSSKPVPAYSQTMAFDGKKEALKIAYFNNALTHKGLDAEIRTQTQALIEALQTEGHTVKGVDFPYLDHIVATYYILTTAEASSNLARYDGIHYGYRDDEAKNMEDTYKSTRTKGFGKEVQRRIMLGTFVLSAGYYDAYYAKAQKVRQMIKQATEELLQHYDFILLPTTPTTAFDIGDKAHQDPVSMYLEDIFTVQANLTGIPAISIPLFQHTNHLPFGLQIMGRSFGEANLMAFAKYLLKQHNCRQKATVV